MAARAVCVNTGLQGGWEVTDGWVCGRCVHQEPEERRAKSTSCRSSSSSCPDHCSSSLEKHAALHWTPGPPALSPGHRCVRMLRYWPISWWTKRLRSLTSTPHVRQRTETMLIPVTVLAVVGLGFTLVASSSDLQLGMWVTWAQTVGKIN